MIHLDLDDAFVEFPIYNNQSRSLKRTVLAYGMGGLIQSDGRVVRALRNITLHLREGDRLGVIGGNGAGKTTLLRTLAGVYEPTSGRVSRNGRVSTLFDMMLGMDQDSTGYENITIRGLLMGLSRQEIDRRAEAIAEFSELRDFLYMPLRTYSSGMIMRLAFSVITSVIPDILLMDEWLSVGDAHFVDKAERRLLEVVGRTGVLVMASHNMDTILAACSTAIILHRGRIVFSGSAGDCVDRYRRFDEKDFLEEPGTGRD